MKPELQSQVQHAIATFIASGDKKNAAELLWPWLTKNDQTDRIWACLDKYSYLAIMGHASASKTFTCAAWFLLHWWENCQETAIIITSDTIASMNRRVWSDIKILMTKTSVPMPGILVDSKRMIKHSHPDDKNAIAGVAAESDDAQSKIQGIHTKRIGLLIDEADNKLSKSIWGAMSNLGASGEIKAVALANPVDRIGDFGKNCEPEDGWASINPEIDFEWDSRTGWHVLRLDGLKSPNILLGEDKYPFLLTNKGVEDIRKQKGENSLEWWCYVRAWYPPSGTNTSIFSPEVIQKSRGKHIWYGETEKIASCDPAFEGGDDCVFMFGTMGKLASNPRRTGIILDKEIVIKRKDTSKPVSIDFGDQIIQLLDENEIKGDNFAIDCTGNALGMSDYIQHARKQPHIAVNFGGSPTDLLITGEDSKKASERYDRFVTELWYAAREWMKFGLFKIPKPSRNLEIQLESRLYDLIGAQRKIRIETKQEMKKNGFGSPDFADTACLLCYVARVRCGTSIPSYFEKKQFNPLKPFQKRAFNYKQDYGVKDLNERR